MTYQQDPNTGRRSYFRRDDGSWSMMPLILGAIVIFGGAYLLFGPARDGLEQTHPVTAPAPVTTPAPTPSAPKN
jgi:hypothetical protein